MLLPARPRRFRSGNSMRSCPLNLSRSAATCPGNGTSPITASMVRLLPEPDSPTTPSDPPSATTMLTPSTARPGAVDEGNTTDKFSISRRAMSALQFGIEGIAQAIADKVEGQHRDQDHDAGKRHHPP